MRKRGFEIIKKYKNKDINVPKRQTVRAAGYDFEAVEDMIIPSVWKKMAERVFTDQQGPLKATLIPTGVKAYMLDDEYLQLSIRSGMSLKTGLMLANGVGIVDADYYNNSDNEGHIMIPVYNYNQSSVTIEKDTRIAQGIFYRYLLASDDKAENIRIGGIGSTGKI